MSLQLPCMPDTSAAMSCICVSAQAPPAGTAICDRGLHSPASLHAVCFGLAILVSLLCAAAFWRLRWHRTATALLWMLWLTIALLMLLGVGECWGEHHFCNKPAAFSTA